MITVLCLYSGISRADDTEEDALWTSSLEPDALVVLDLSGSMNASPLGNIVYSSNNACDADTVHCNSATYNCTGGYCWLWGDIACRTKQCFFPYGASSSCVPNTTACTGTNCLNGFCAASKTGCSVDCSRIGIAKKAIFSIMDDNGTNTITSADETSLGVRMGYMRFYNASGDETDGYTTGANKLAKYIGNRYSNTFCGSNSSCAVGGITYAAPSSSCSVSSVNSGCAYGGTLLATSLKEAKSYLDAHKASDGSAGACRQKFVVLVSDGEDTYACGGSGSETDTEMYKRRRASVFATKALKDTGAASGYDGYRVFVIGFGSNMPAQLKNTLNWMAYYGGTDNPLEANSGSTAAYTVQAADENSATGCGTESTGTVGTYCPYSWPSAPCYAATRDPGNTPLSGYAFIAANADEIGSQLKMAFSIIREANYSFSQASVQLNRTVDENFIYEGSIQPVSGDPFWIGHLRKYAIDADGGRGSELWDAGAVLATTSAASRTIKTYKAGSIVDFKTPTAGGTITATDLSVATDALRDMVAGFFRGEAAYNLENWKLGDIFRSKPITVGTPSFFFEDMRDENNAFSAFRSSHVRASSNSPCNRVVLVGANDGQLHAFKTSDGTEAWSFIPPNLLSRLKLIAHNTHPSSLTHQSYVDGPVTVADAWVPASASDGKSKNVSDWKTHLLFGEGQGASSNLWSSSAYCDSGFNQTYTATYQYYCGYYCLDVTDPLSPTYKWRFGLTAAAAPYMGAPWSTPQVGRVLDGGNEKWVAFVGGGYLSPGAANSGKGLFVFNMTDGSLLWSYTRANNSNLDNIMPAPPAIADTDSDGFIDTVYIGDTDSSMWRFKLCLAADGTSCTTSNWTGTLFFDSTNAPIRPIFTAATVAKDGYGNVWVYWGTGDKIDPTAPNAQEQLYALIDDDRTSTYDINDMLNIGSTGEFDYATDYPDKHGWRILMTGQGEKILAEPTVFGGVVYFTTYTPPSGNDPCALGGTATLYGLGYTTGAAAIDTGGTDPVRSTSIGTGIPSAPVISMRPGNDPTPDLYVTTSGGGGTAASTDRVNIDPQGIANRTNIIFWRDTRVE